MRWARSSKARRRRSPRAAATITIQSYGTTLYNAAQLNQTLKAALDGLVELDDVARCQLNSDYNYTDATKRLYRYQAVFDIIHY